MIAVNKIPGINNAKATILASAKYFQGFDALVNIYKYYINQAIDKNLPELTISAVGNEANGIVSLSGWF